jgi:phenylpropionate dioxygenase-like ring-hydroxylating dioxygenase large terminal subunit
MLSCRKHDNFAGGLANLPRDPRADDYPMPAVPYGWYAVLRSAELRPGKVVNLHYFGRALIAFRGSDGQAAVRDAHCPHYGAHLGVGGKVVDGTVECPFHGWRFGTDGRCVEAPFAVRTPKVSIGGFPVREHSGLVFVYAGPPGEPADRSSQGESSADQTSQGKSSADRSSHRESAAAEPAWEVPEIPEATSREFAEPVDDTCTARIHIQEMRENIVDESHFHFIHGQAEPPVQDWRVDGPFAEVRGRIRRRVFGWDVDNTFDAFMYGPGVMVVRTHGPALSVTAVALSTPVDDRTSELRMLYYLRKPARAPFLTPLFKLVFRREALGEVREEVIRPGRRASWWRWGGRP